MGLFFQVFMSCFAALLVLKATDRLLKKLPWRRIVELSSSTTVTLTLNSGDVEESEDGEVVGDEVIDNRNLWERLEDAGFSRIKQSRVLRVTDVGKIKTSPYLGAPCPRCMSIAYSLSEVYLRRPSSKNMPIGSVELEEIGTVCAQCGCVLFVNGSKERNGRLAPLMAKDVNFFDVLQFIENLDDDDSKSTLNAAELSLLEKKRDELERQLGAVRTAIMRKKHESGTGDVFREADRATDPEPSEEVTSTGSEFQKSST